jgi:hypothetical protein
MGGMIVTVPGVPELVTDKPGSGDAPVFITCTTEEELCVDGEIVKVTVAITPFAIVDALIPHSKQVELPAALLQEIDLPADVAALPALIEAAEKSAVEYVNVHWASAGCTPDAAKERLNVTTLPGTPEPDDKFSATLCAHPALQTETATRHMPSGLTVDPNASVSNDIRRGMRLLLHTLLSE